ncbi:MAG: formate/nitrite transporter family protein [Halodesulfurarchaeum sp.]|nr:formate/nitrite transporter family protein [Halodesulfurarchaeum sp.]
MPEEEPDAEDSVRKAVEQSRSGAPAVGRVVRDRFSTDEVFQRIVAAADEEITAGNRELFFSGLAAGFAITITVLLYVSMTATTGGDPVLSVLLYPLGFIYIILGGYQLYTENTLPPVALTLERLASVPALLRNWIVVLAGNFLGGLAGAAALAWGGVLSPEAAAVAAEIAQKGVDTPAWPLFFKAVFAGLIVAGVVWVEYAARDTISRLVVIYLAFLAIPLGGLFHVVVSFTETMYLSFTGDLSLVVGLTDFVIPVLLGNTVGGVVLVTLVNYFQTSEKRLAGARFEGGRRQLSWREMLLGGTLGRLFGFHGRSYVPLVDTTPGDGDTDGPYHILVPLADPSEANALVKLAETVARTKEQAILTFVHVVPEYDPHSRYSGSGRDRLVADSSAQLERLCDRIEAEAIRCRSSTVVSHRSFSEVFDIAERDGVDLLLVERGDNHLWSSSRAEGRLDELTRRLPCDVCILEDRGFDPDRLLLPVVDNPHAALNAEIARALREEYESSITLLSVISPEGDRELAEAELRNWAIDHGLEDETQVVETGSVEAAIERGATDHTMILVGATEQGLLSRSVTGTLHYDVISETGRTVLMAERPSDRSLLQRLFKRRRN